MVKCFTWILRCHRFQHKNFCLWLWWNNLHWTGSSTENKLKHELWNVGNDSLDVVCQECDPWEMGVMRVSFQMVPDACLPGCIFFTAVKAVKAEQCVEVLPSWIDRTWRSGLLRCGNGSRIPQWRELCREGTLESSWLYSGGFLFLWLVVKN